jgi:hypothetical protein
MEEAPQNGKESSHSAHTDGMNELVIFRELLQRMCSVNNFPPTDLSGKEIIQHLYINNLLIMNNYLFEKWFNWNKLMRKSVHLVGISHVYIRVYPKYSVLTL